MRDEGQSQLRKSLMVGLGLLVMSVWILGSVCGCLSVKDVMRREMISELKSMPREEMVRMIGRPVVRPQEDYLSIADDQIFRGVGQNGFVTGTLFMLSWMIGTAFAGLAMIIAWRTYYLVVSIGVVAHEDASNPDK